MGDQGQLERLRRSVAGWNKWREEHPDEPVDLREANLEEANLEKANLAGAHLGGASLTLANLEGASLEGAYLAEADLMDAYLAGANLTRAELSDADLMDANLRGANLEKAELTDANLEGATLAEANLREASSYRVANLKGADLKGADLTKASLQETNFETAVLTEANLAGAFLARVNLVRVDLTYANLEGAYLEGANLTEANLTEANLTEANLAKANFARTILTEANLTGANLHMATLVETQMENADLQDCYVYGVSAWDVHLEGAKQTGLVITPQDTAEITVDDLEVAQFIYLLLNNEKIRRVIDTVTSKVVLILGRFAPERKAVLDALRETLRAKNYSPVVFDFEKPASRNLTETIRVLAGMARFVIADITDAKSIPQELMAIVPDLPSVPVQPLLLESQSKYGTFDDFRQYRSVLEERLYASPDHLVSNVEALVITPAERRLEELRSRR